MWTWSLFKKRDLDLARKARYVCLGQQSAPKSNHLKKKKKKNKKKPPIFPKKNAWDLTKKKGFLN